MEKNKVKNRSEQIIYILTIIGIVGVLNYLSTRGFKRIDMTESKEYSISKATKNVLRNLDDIINIKVFFSKDLPPHLHKTITDVKDILAEYQAYAGKRLKISWIDPKDNEELKSQARSLGIPEVQLQTFEKDKQQVMNGYLGIAVLFEDKKEAIPVVQNLQNLEYDLTTAIMKVSRKSEPHIGIVKMDTLPDYLPPQYEQKIDMSSATKKKLETTIEALKNNYKVSIVNIDNGEPIDSTIKTLIVPGVENITSRNIFEIDQFFMKNGKLIVLAEGMNIQFQWGIRAYPQESKLFDLLEHYGVKVEKSLLLDASCGQVSIPQKFGPFQMNVAVPYPYFVRVGKDGFNQNNPAVSPLTEVVFPWISPLKLLVDSTSGIKSNILAKSSSKSWVAEGAMDLNPQQKWTLPSNKSDLKEHNLIVYLTGSFKSYFDGKKIPPVKEVSPTDTNQKDSSINASDTGRTIVTSNKDAHLVVIGDVDFVTGQNATAGNVTLLLNLVDWLSLDNNLISIRTRTVKDRTMNADMLQTETARPTIIRIINILLMPVLLIIIGIIIFIKRKERRQVSGVSNVNASGDGSGKDIKEEKSV